MSKALSAPRVRTLAFTFALMWAGLSSISSRASEYLRMEARINGKRASLIFDSGSDHLVLCREAVQRLGLRFREPETNAVLNAGEVPMGVTEECSLLLAGMEARTRFRVFDPPDYVELGFEGAVGWRNLRDNIIEIDASKLRLRFLENVPKKALSWERFGVVTNADLLQLEVPQRDFTMGIVPVDTGDDGGVSLPPEKWRTWRATNSARPMTLR